MGALPACMSLCHMCAWCPWQLEDSCRTPYRRWELNLGSMEEQPVLEHLSSPGKDSYSCSFVTDKLYQRMTTLCFDLNCKLLCCGDSAGKSTTCQAGYGSSVPGTHVVKGENQFLSVALTSTWMLWYLHVHIHTDTG